MVIELSFCSSFPFFVTNLQNLDNIRNDQGFPEFVTKNRIASVSNLGRFYSTNLGRFGTGVCMCVCACMVLRHGVHYVCANCAYICTWVQLYAQVCACLLVQRRVTGACVGGAGA